MFYLNFNLSFFGQIIAHYSYVPTAVNHLNEAGSQYCNSGGACLTEPWGWPYFRNSATCGQDYPEQTYTVNGLTYTLRHSTYLYEEPCTVGQTAYYFPLNPKWSVADIRLPGSIFWKYFLQQSVFLLIWLSGFIIYAVLAASRHFVQDAIQEIRIEFQERRMFNAIAISLFSPLFVVLVFHIAAYILDFEHSRIFESGETFAYYINNFSLFVGIACFFLTSKSNIVLKIMFAATLASTHEYLVYEGPWFVLRALLAYLLFCLFYEVNRYFSRGIPVTK
ncbi:MAG: hypothetical protein KDI90_04395 [Alphaproteobacteria bacterium]|nr:hypothetical protein [Alphaproteobacteria bacterium]MCB9975423.1 hypothetical protein [Rhodospirillales bacterium]